MATAGIGTSRPLTLLLFLIINLLSNTITGGGRVYADNGVFSVKYKYAGRERSLSTLKAHDISRQLRFLAGVDIPLGGSGRPDAVGLYYAKIGIGTPSKDYYVQVDTGSDIVWVNCIQCRECPRTSSLGMELTPYDLEESTTGKLVSCDEQFCLEVNGGPLSGCTTNMSCPYLQIYGDGSSTAGYFVKDYVQYNRVSGDLETTAANGSIKFGLSSRHGIQAASSTICLRGRSNCSGVSISLGCPLSIHASIDTEGILSWDSGMGNLRMCNEVVVASALAFSLGA
ncbi:aspartic proteinase-like protein 2 isoform X2 [Cucumis melo var. makuwa]|uniref:Aspartic proteinase-like protein 2 isoform X2 n=1 Tax=Cucumis melo var. makuwa TaxID=1194695 RepID=A0A5D3D0J8_CUCMM|nr:aspartic proteinase-like protein 2 isoform X2 [Cucumis melo var. makuwa]